MAPPISVDALEFDGFRLDLRRGVLYRLSKEGSAEPVRLGSRTAMLLGLLTARQGEVVLKEEIIQALWAGRIVEEGNLNVQVSKLRRIIDDPAAKTSRIKTIPGRGYAFVSAIARLPADTQTQTTTMPPPGISHGRDLSIVVLPFGNLSSDPRQRYLADGITEDLTTSLSRFPGISVISRNTAFAYRAAPRDTRQIGRELGVRYVLEGSVRRSGRRLRIGAQLIDAEADIHLWAERYDWHVSELLELQDEIAVEIAGAIEPQLLKSERERVARRAAHNDSAYESYQRGLWHLYRYTQIDNIEAQRLFGRALAADPEYPQATAHLAISICNSAYLGWTSDPDSAYSEAYELAERAVNLDPRYPGAHFSLGLACMWTSKPDHALLSFEEAIALNPSYAAAHVLLGQMHLYSGDPEKAIVLAELGIRLSPRDPRLFIWLTSVAGGHYQLRQYAQALETGRRSWRLNRHWPAGLRYAVAAMGQLNRLEDAKEAVAQLRLLNPDFGFAERNLRRLYRDQAALSHILDGLRKAGFR
jgi:TolB-like protein